MNALLKLHRAEGFSEGERAVAAWILRDPDAFVRAPAKSVASSCNVSQATVYRLCAKMEVSGIAELKAAVAAGTAEWMRLRASEVDVNFPVCEGASTVQIVGALQSEYASTVASAAALMDPDEVDRCAEAICESSVVDVYTTAGHLFIARNFQLQMREIGIRVDVPSSDHDRYLSVAASGPDHLAIVISFGGHGSQIPETIRGLHDLGTPLLLISSDEKTCLDRRADFRLRMPAGENFSHKVSAFSTRLSLLYLLDVLYTAVFARDYKENLRRKVELAETGARYFGDGVCSGLL